MNDPEALAVVRTAEAYRKALAHFAVKWHQDNCPERGDFPRWYADRAKAREQVEALGAELDSSVAAYLAKAQECAP